MSTGHSQMPKQAEPNRVRRTRWRWGGLCLAVMAVLSHPWWLRAFGEYLAAEEPIPPADVAVVLSGDHRLQRAAELWEEGTVSEIWVLEREATYAVSVGILPPTHVVEVEELTSLGIPDDRIRVLVGGMRDIDDAARIMARAVRESPERSALVLCDRAHSRNMRLVLDHVVSPLSGTRIGVLGVPADAFHEGNWWKSRTGWKVTFNATCELLFTMIHGVDAERVPVLWNPDEFEREFVSVYEGTGCRGSE